MRRVPDAWRNDPVARTFEVLRLEARRWVILVVHAGDGRVRDARGLGARWFASETP